MRVIWSLRCSAVLHGLERAEEPFTGIMWQPFKSLLLCVRGRMTRTEGRLLWSPPAVFAKNTGNIWNDCDETDECEVPQPLQVLGTSLSWRGFVSLSAVSWQLLMSKLSCRNSGPSHEPPQLFVGQCAVQIQILSGSTEKSRQGPLKDELNYRLQLLASWTSIPME